MNIGKTFIGSSHTYEVVLSNKGEIDAIFSSTDPKNEIENQFSFLPNEGILMPGGYQLIQISFDAKILGNFRQMFEFIIDGTDEKLKIEIQGEVIGPTFFVNPQKIDYGTISYGFSSTQVFDIINTSLIPMNFELRILDFDDDEGNDLQISDV